MYYFKLEVDRLIEAALDQRRPSKRLRRALNAILDRTHHKAKQPDVCGHNVPMAMPCEACQRENAAIAKVTG